MRRPMFLILFLVILCGGVHGMIRSLSLEELVAGSDLIVIASLKSSEEKGKTPDGLPQIENILTVATVLKGVANASSELKVSTIGGFEDEVAFSPRQKGILFLKKAAAGGYEVNNLVQGWWPLGAGDAPTGMGTGISVEKLKGTIKAVAEGKVSPTSAAPSSDQL